MHGNVIIQSYNPENFAIQCAQKQDYELFYDTEIALREQLKYPPFCDIIVISFTGINEEEIKDISNKSHKYFIDNMQKSFRVFTPMPAPIERIQNKIRYRIIIKGEMNQQTNEILNKYLKKIYEKNLKYTKIGIEINPNSMY